MFWDKNFPHPNLWCILLRLEDWTHRIAVVLLMSDVTEVGLPFGFDRISSLFQYISITLYVELLLEDFSTDYSQNVIQPGTSVTFFGLWFVQWVASPILIAAEIWHSWACCVVLVLHLFSFILDGFGLHIDRVTNISLSSAGFMPHHSQRYCISSLHPFRSIQLTCQWNMSVFSLFCAVDDMCPMQKASSTNKISSYFIA